MGRGILGGMRRKLLPIFFSIPLLALTGWLALDSYLISTDTSLQGYLSGMMLAQTGLSGRGQQINLNLHNHILSLYEDGVLVRQGRIAGAGNPNDLTATPTGDFHILSKENMHVSRLSGVLMPYSMRFYQGYYFHDIPLTPDGLLIKTRYSHGCVRLPNDFAVSFFDWANVGADVHVYRSHLARTSDGTRVYLLTEDGARRPISSEAAFLRQGYWWQDVAVVPRAEIAGLPLGEPIY